MDTCQHLTTAMLPGLALCGLLRLESALIALHTFDFDRAETESSDQYPTSQKNPKHEF